ncbi:Hypothetical predicted protein [Drosophila guanche]|uniref:Nucleoporin NUP35 n=1 Tax=Drosophila guanche TaxID=7266 RepID=A0A3B0JZN8_DROGU|nr:Hypothetical predicted protein [Drosophila guanche]
MSAQQNGGVCAPLKIERGATLRSFCATAKRCNWSLNSGFDTEVAVPPNPLIQKRRWLTHESPSDVIAAELLAESKRHPRKPQNPIASQLPYAPFQWVEISGFPCAATEQILRSFHCVGTILKKRHTPHGTQLQFGFTVEAARALEFNSVLICGYKVRVERLLEDPELQELAQVPRCHESPLPWQNPQCPQFDFSQRQCSRRQLRWNRRLYRDIYQKNWFWFCFILLLGLLFHLLGFLWRSLDAWMKSRNAVRNDPYPGAGFHCELVNSSVNRHVTAERESATKATHFREYPARKGSSN